MASGWWLVAGGWQPDLFTPILVLVLVLVLVLALESSIVQAMRSIAVIVIELPAASCRLLDLSFSSSFSFSFSKFNSLFIIRYSLFAIHEFAIHHSLFTSVFRRRRAINKIPADIRT